MSNKGFHRFFLLSAVVYLLLVSFISYPLTTFLKPLPIFCLLIWSFYLDLPRRHKVFLQGALLFSALGDITLSLPITNQLEVGLGLFLIAHCSYIRLFIQQVHVTKKRLLACLAVIAISIGMLVILMPSLGQLLIPVIVYVIVITIMSLSAILNKNFQRRIVWGALNFMLSDSMIAINQFLFPQLNLTLAIMLTYYLAQRLIFEGIKS